MPKEVRITRNRQSPGGLIQCNNPNCDGFVSRRKFNNFLRFNQRPKCGKCGSVDLIVSSQYEIRGNRLIWTPREKLTSKRVVGRIKR